MKVSVVGGAGIIGSTTAFAIATQGLADDIVLIDRRENFLAIHFIDINDAIVASKQNVKIRPGSYQDMANSDVVIVAAAAPFRPFNSRQELIMENLLVIREISQGIEHFCPNAIVITASNPPETLTYALYLLSSSRDRRKFMGYSFNDTVRLRRFVAEVQGIPPSKVDGFTIGEHGDSQVPVFSSVTIDRQPITLSEQTKHNIRKRCVEFIHKWQEYGTGRSSGWVSSIGIAALVRAIGNDTREILTCCAVLNGEYGYEGFCMSVPAVIGRQGIEKILELKLFTDEQQGLRQTTNILKEAARSVEKALKIT